MSNFEFMNVMLLFIINLMLLLLHPFYLSVNDIKFNNSNKSIEGTLKVTIHDLESSLTKIHHKTIDLHKADTTGQIRVLQNYLKPRLQFFDQQQPIDYQVIGFEVDGVDLFVYYESLHLSQPKSLKVKSEVLYEFSSQEINIVNIEIGDKKTSKKLVFPENEVIFF